MRIKRQQTVRDFDLNITIQESKMKLEKLTNDLYLICMRINYSLIYSTLYFYTSETCQQTALSVYLCCTAVCSRALLYAAQKKSNHRRAQNGNYEISIS